MWIKICGITSTTDARAVADAGADALGLNFYPPSPRSVTADQAEEIADCVRSQLDLAGVFVNRPLDEIVSIVAQVGLTAVQFHGDETAAEIAEVQRQCPDVATIRAIRIGDDSPPLCRLIPAADQLQRPLDGVLVDAFVPGEYGGTGHKVRPALVEGHEQLAMPLILAGGLRAENVAAAVSQVQPWGVDTASGVEVSPGIKSAEQIRQFVTQARSTSTNPSPQKLK